MMRNYKKNCYSLPHSFGFALRGVWYALHYERNLRIHFAAGIYALYFSRYYALSRSDYALLLFAVGLVLICEMLNTAIEATVDLEAPAFHELAKTAKDVAAGAVLIAACVSVGVAFFLFWDPVVFQIILRDIFDNLLVWIFLLAITAFWVAMPRFYISKRKRNGV